VIAWHFIFPIQLFSGALATVLAAAYFAARYQIVRSSSDVFMTPQMTRTNSRRAAMAVTVVATPATVRAVGFK
jgi:hypothetical protein